MLSGHFDTLEATFEVCKYSQRSYNDSEVLRVNIYLVQRFLSHNDVRESCCCQKLVVILVFFFYRGCLLFLDILYLFFYMINSCSFLTSLNKPKAGIRIVLLSIWVYQC